MIELKEILIIVLLSLNLICFVLGYLLGKLNHNQAFIDTETNYYKINKSKDSKRSEKIDIDCSKVVTKIKTDDLEKKYDTLGETKSSQEKIENSVNKLKNMKG
jgi:FtsZ-interacting cell division protein ZipA